MQRLTVHACVALVTFIIGLSTAAIPTAFRFDAHTSGGAEQEILETEREYIRAHVRRDAATLERILADDFTLEFPSGRVTTKAARLALLENADFVFLSLDTDNVKVWVNEDEAVVTGQAVLHGRYSDQDFTSPAYGFVRLYEKRQGRWQIRTVQIIRAA